MAKVYYTVYMNDGCPCGRTEGYKTLREAKKELKEAIEYDKRICQEDGVWDGELGFTYYIEKNTENDNTIYVEEVYSVTA